jgi:CheY-like chemotaxis protein
MPKQILIVDDEAHIRKVLELKLVSAGYEVKEATDVVSGLRAAEAERPQLIVTDYKMPGELTGIDLVRSIRAIPQIAQTPVILLTGSVAVLRQLRVVLEEIRGITLLAKPFSPRALLKEVQQLIGEEA